MKKEEARAIIRGVLADHARLTANIGQLADGDDLFAAGMTSFASVNVMIALEDRFDVEFPDDMMSRATFSSVDSIVDALATISAFAA